MRDVLGGHLRVLALDVCGAREGLDLADRPVTDRDRGGEIGEDLHDPRAGHELGQVHPVRADVAHGAQLSRALRLQAPVPVRRLREPVLQVAAVDVPDVADVARADPLARFLDERVEADVEVRAVDET